MAASGAAAFPGVAPVQPGGQAVRFGRRPRYFIRGMNGRSAQIQAPDGTIHEVPASHMPPGSQVGAPLDEQAFVNGHNQRQAQGPAPSFMQTLAGTAPGGQRTTHPAAPAVSAPSAVGASPLPAVVSPAPSISAPASTPAAPPPSPKGVPYGSQQMLDYLKQYGPGDTGLSLDQVNALLGRPAGTSAGTAAYNQAQQQFTANNDLYGITGYQGNANQVASQVAGGAQSAGIPQGVLGSSFYRGGSNYGGQQTADNSLNGQNGAVNWNDPSVASYGVTNEPYIAEIARSLADAKAGLMSTPLTTGAVGRFVSGVPGVVPLLQQQAQQAQVQAGVTSGAAPSSFAANLAAGPASTGSVSYAPVVQPAIQQQAQTNQGSVSGGGYTPPTQQRQTTLVSQPQTPATPVTQNAQSTSTTTAQQSQQPRQDQQAQQPTQQPAQPSTGSQFMKLLANNGGVAPATGPATESLKGRGHF